MPRSNSRIRFLTIPVLLLAIFLTSSIYISGKETFFKASENPQSLFEEISMDNALDKIKSGSDVILYFGYEGCPYCQKAKPVLRKVSRKLQRKVYYVKTRDSQKNLMYSEKQRKRLVKYISEYMSPNEGENNKLWLYVPLVVHIKDRKAVSGYEGIGNDKPKLNGKQKKKLIRKYTEIMA